jgi:hypothetical protein
MSLAEIIDIAPTKPARPIRVREVIRMLAAQHPGAGDAVLANHLAEQAADDPALFKAVCRFTVITILFDQTRIAQSQKARAPAARKAARSRTREAVKKVREKIRACALDLIMPNSKQLRFCLGHEVAAFGAGFARITQKLRDVLCDGSRPGAVMVQGVSTSNSERSHATQHERW